MYAQDGYQELLFLCANVSIQHCGLTHISAKPTRTEDKEFWSIYMMLQYVRLHLKKNYSLHVLFDKWAFVFTKAQSGTHVFDGSNKKRKFMWQLFNSSVLNIWKELIGRILNSVTISAHLLISMFIARNFTENTGFLFSFNNWWVAMQRQLEKR